MKARTNAFLVTTCCILGGIAVSVTAAQLVRRPLAKPAPEPTVDIASYVEGVSAVSWSINEDGRVQIAGLTRFHFDNAGNAVVEAKRGGDFSTDPTLTFNLPVVQNKDGHLSVVGLEKVQMHGDNVVLTIDLSATASSGQVSGSGPVSVKGCKMFKPINCDPVRCEGDCNLGFSCWFKVNGDDLICDCVPPSE